MFHLCKKAAVRLLEIVAVAIIATTAAAADVTQAEGLADKLLNYRLPDGGILVNKAHEPKGRLVPYFSNLAALGWVETAKVTTSTQKREVYLEATKAWINWYAVHQNPDGTIYDFEGPTSSLHPTGTYDSTDSYAATYALLVWRYYEVTNDLEFVRGKTPSLDGAYNAVLLTMDNQGLTYAHPHYAYRFLMDNCEVAAGFVAFNKLYTILKLPKKAAESRQHLENLKGQFSKYYQPDFGAFAYALDPYGVAVGDFTKGYPDAMANLFAITYLAPSGAETTNLLNRIKEKFWSQSDSQNFPQWWTWPAIIAGDVRLATTSLARLQAQANEATAHSYLVGMAAAIQASGVSSIRFPEVVCTWPQLTTVSPRPSLQVPHDGNLFLPGSSIIITGHKASGSLTNGSWQTSNASLPVSVNYDITTSSGYLQLNLVWPGQLNLSAEQRISLFYTGPDASRGSQLQVTLVESDGDWWDAALPASQAGLNNIILDLGKLSQNPWGKAGDQKMNLSAICGIRFQIGNKAKSATNENITISQMQIMKSGVSQ